MSTAQPTPSSSPSSSTTGPQASPDFIRNAAIASVVVFPILIALPPRKLDFYTLLCLGGFGIGANILSKEHTGIGMVQRMKGRIVEMASPMPDGAKAVKEQLIREKAERERRRDLAAMNRVGLGADGKVLLEEKSRAVDKGTIEEEARKEFGIAKAAKEEEEEGRGMPKGLEKIWLGDEGKDWKRKRNQREREALEQGRGYADLILDQIKEVWGVGKDKVEDVKANDEKAIKDQQEEMERK